MARWSGQGPQGGAGVTAAFLAIPLLALVIVAGLAAGFRRITGTDNAAIELPLLLAGGVVVLVLALGVTTIVFRQIGVADPNEELGLPQGSVRAVIALALILIFAIMVLFLFERSVAPITASLGELSREELEQIPPLERYRVDRVAVQGDEPERFRVTRLLTDLTEDRQAIANQVITILGTLVTAIAAFYFGANSVTAARHAIAGVGPEVRVAGAPLRRLARGEGGTLLPLDLAVVTSPPGQAVVTSVVPPDAGRVRALETELYRFEPADDTTKFPATLRFALANRPEVPVDVTVELPAN